MSNFYFDFQYILQLIYQLIFFALTVLIIQIFTNITWFITFILAITRISNRSLSHTPLPINSLHSHLPLSSFYHLLWHMLASNLHLHLPVWCHSVSCFISSWHWIKYFNIQIFNNIQNTQFCIWIIDIVATTAAFTCFNA